MESKPKILNENSHVLEQWLLEEASLEWLQHILSRKRGMRNVSTSSQPVHSGQRLSSLAHQETEVSGGAPAPPENVSQSFSNETDEISESEERAFRSVVPRSARKSVTSDLFHQWLSAHQPRGDIRKQTKEISGVISSASLKKKTSSRGSIEQNDRLMELILDISNELDIDVLCHKIAVSLSSLAKADRCSMFLARGPRENRYLEAKLFDVQPTTTLDEALARANTERIFVIMGDGVAGQVALTKEHIIINDVHGDHRFKPEVDEKLGFSTSAVMCLPVCNYEGEIIGVVQLMNDRNPGFETKEFSETDVKLMERYLTFCGIGIQNAQLFEVSILEYKKNQLLLSLARSLFQEQMSLERLVSTIISEAKDMLKCQRCTVYLLDLKAYNAMESSFFHVGHAGQSPGVSPSTSSISVERAIPPSFGGIEFIIQASGSESELPLLQAQSDSKAPQILAQALEEISFQQAWEMEGQGMRVYTQHDKELQISRRSKIAKYVAYTKEVLNLNDVASWLGEEPFVETAGFVPLNMLCVPIFNGNRDVIGVAQLINKENNKKFDESEISLFEAFGIFCGIGIHNTKVYEGACKLMAKQKVALDCLSYHASASDGDTEWLVKAEIPSAQNFNLFKYNFDDTPLQDEETFKVTIRMFMEFGLINQFQIPYKVLCQWVLSVKKNYRPVKYHNWRHALNVCQTMFTVLKTGKMDRFMDDIEIFGLLVACLCHDLDHRGTNNAFQTKMDSPLAVLYSTSTMEHHHFDQCVMILSSEGNNIFQGMSTDDYRHVMRILEQAILSTDLALYFRKKDLFLETANKGEIDWQGDKKELLCGMLMTACDVSAIAKPWELQHKMAKRVADEFFDQGDMEKLRLNIQPIAMMDRERKDELPKMQVEFIDVVCKPLYTSLSESFPWIKPLLDGCIDNREKWADLAEKVEMGLTWIDHDTIDKPIEELVAGNAESTDFEFKVETLKNSSISNSSSRRESAISKKNDLKLRKH
ncbi:cGMP-specific 3',5'-cyclic phosphodiesterase-like isoform X2 [Tigriopus californicus]|uniref:cGMP-specific 3',5'-cyclic phosphodiesterase-like isoform X2 n=1 Tax=Tigriopus californicus TaxID=6832 RepID=UPI0027DAA990|nr:cGMP-specific 3',5'-cyclic phosphodiesterase-like isoform X2 [Tigriopus californicus]